MISVKNYSLSFGKKKILRSINYEFSSGITAVVGPSGAGKSSFVLSLNRLTDFYPNSKYEGEIFFGDRDVLKNSKHLREIRLSIGTVFQKPTPFPISINKNLEVALDEKGNISKSDYCTRIEEDLRKDGLWEDVKDKLHTSALRLSGGQQQKLCIARTLLTDPKILILDEPCSSLDPISTQQIEELLKQIAQNIPVIIVTHNLKQAKRISENLVVFSIIEGIGQIVEAGKSLDVFQNPQNEFTKAYLEYEIF